MAKAYLELLSKGSLNAKGEVANHSMILNKSHTIIGRDEHRADIYFLSETHLNSSPMNFVSGIHCTIFYDGNNKSYLLLDNHSRNGTRLDGEHLIPGEYYPLVSGARIELGIPPNNGALLLFHSETPLPRSPSKTAMLPPLEEPTQSFPLVPQTQALKPHVFLSHSSQDNMITQSVHHHLVSDPKLATRLEVWLDRTELQVGEKWTPAIENAIRSAVGVIVMVSKHALESRWVQREINFAAQQDKPLFVVQVGEVNHKDAPILLHEVQWVNLMNDYNKGIAELIEELAKL